MARRGENIRKRKDGRWEGRYKSSIKPDGKSKYISVYGKSYTEVKNKLSEIKNGLYCFKSSPYIEKNFGDVLMLWLKSNRIKLKGSTENKYKYMIEKHIKPQLGGRRISTVTASVINDFLLEKKRQGRLDGGGGLAASYVKTMAIIIESAIKFAAAEGFCKPLNNQILKPPGVKKEPEILSLSAQKHFECSVGDSVNETITGIYIGLYAGLRIGEVCALSWNDIDFASQIICVRHTVSRVEKCDSNCGKGSVLIIDTPKTNASIREIPIPSILLHILMRMKEFSVSEYVISTHSGFLSTRTFDYRYKKVLRELGIPVVNFHAFRHTFATRCIEVGMDIKSLSQILGHANVSTTLNTYVHPSMDTIRRKIEKLQALTIS